MPRQEYQRELDQLRTDVVDMSQLVLERLNSGAAVLEEKDDSRAQAVIQGDHEVNERYLTLENDCIRLLALQQPVAGDLRFIASSFKIVTDLERIGDLATNLAGYGNGTNPPIVDTVDLQPIAIFAWKMVQEAMSAYEDEDAEKSRETAAEDDELDELCRQASEQIIRELLVKEPSHVSEPDQHVILEDISRALLIIRDLERVGDHAVNICARTVYMIENDIELIY